MRFLVSQFQKTKAFDELRGLLAAGARDAWVYRVPRAARGTLLSALLDERPGKCVVVVPDAEQADQLLSDVEAFLAHAGRDQEWVLRDYPPANLFPDPGEKTDRAATRRRLAAIEALRDPRPGLVVAPVASLCHPTLSPALFERATFALSRGDPVDPGELAGRLLDGGYERAAVVEEPGQFSIRGGIVDVFSAAAELPARLELFGDELDSLRLFDPDDQRSVESIETLACIPAQEVVVTREVVDHACPLIRESLDNQLSILAAAGKREECDRLRADVERDLERLEQLSYFAGIDQYRPFLFAEPSTLLDHLGPKGLVVVCEPEEVETHHARLDFDLGRVYQDLCNRGDQLAPAGPPLVPLSHLEAQWSARQAIKLTTNPPDDLASAPGRGPEFELRLVEGFGNRMQRLTGKLREWVDAKRHVTVATNNPDRFLELLREAQLPAERIRTGEVREPSGAIRVVTPRLWSGFELPEADLVVLTDGEAFGRAPRRRHRARKRTADSLSIRTVGELRPYDYVVHINHGIGVYRGIVSQDVGGRQSDYLLVEYAGADKLYVPVAQIDRLQKYIGTGSEPPTVSSLKGQRWQKQRSRAKQSTQKLAGELTALYSARENAVGHVFDTDQPWLRELEDSFEYDETPDQLAAIGQVKEDMTTPKPMDRLICGDVGFGKTEVAVRAAFAAVLSGKQVAVLVPTTVLAQQHHTTFKERLSAYPVEVHLLSRFRTPQQQQVTLEQLKNGTVDIVIGTHRLLQDDVAFKELGLAIVDEEQRFGVKQKERLKELRNEVDVLTLTATPIPRTLHMALGGIRELSIINDPPEGRLPIRTHAARYTDDLVRRAVLRELDRDGQVFYVHNRVESIYHVQEHLQRLIPGARVGVGHGQLNEDDLEQTMLDFLARRFDILLCTTIIESGLDIPNVNTIVVDNCDLLGLAQLYQLRGRVGRADRQAYSYFLFGRRGKLTPQAAERLQAVQELTDLGSGFKLAMRDLEIRGAGNLLGGEQHGFVDSVGFEMYCEMLAEAVRTTRKEPVEVAVELPEVELPIPGRLPESFIDDSGQRLLQYRRMVAVRSEEEADTLADELRDRYGKLPREAENLVRVLRLRLLGLRCGVNSIAPRDGQHLVLLNGGHGLTSESLVRVYAVLTRTVPPPVLKRITAVEEGLLVNLHQLNDSATLRIFEQVLEALEKDKSFQRRSREQGPDGAAPNPANRSAGRRTLVMA
jgi:transcription-repair coupling factor (superfamily II helicase)